MDNQPLEGVVALVEASGAAAGLLGAGRCRRGMGLDPASDLSPDCVFIGIVIVASNQEDFQVRRPPQSRNLVTPLPPLCR